MLAREAIRLAVDFGNQKLVQETDSLGLVKVITDGKQELNWSIHGFVQDIRVAI